MTRDEQWLLDEKYHGEKTAAYEADRKRLASGEPLAYVIGYQPFLGLKIYLDSHPLIPRPETEWWTEQLLSSLQAESASLIEERTERATKVSYERSELENLKYSCGDGASQSNFSAEKYAVPKAGSPIRPVTFLDLCAGSGAVGCAALARLPDAQVYFGEIDPAHEATILENIRENDLDQSRATIRIGNLFEPFVGTKFDIIAANPPYIPAGRVLPRSVADHEPALALLAGEDGLDVIRRIAIELPNYLAENGTAWIECDHAAAAAAAALFEAQGLGAEIRTDQYGKPRIVVVSFPV